MRKALMFFLAVTFALTVSSQTTEKKWGVGIGIGAYGGLENGNMGFMPELYLGRYLSPRFDLLLQGNMGIWRSEVENDLDMANAFLNLRYKLYNETKNFRPYLYAGPGYLADNQETGLNFDAGLGAKYYFSPATALYAKAGYINGIEVAGETENFWQATLGMEFDFGGSKSGDSDKDGVPDKKDKCPNTPTGVAVDENGCPKDSDGDGVSDAMDDCPTEAGITSLKGCPDKDKDGVADKDDACPDVAGAQNLKGCPDADGDGVADKEDKCPDTKKGMKVDASGCPSDQDKDGVADSEDNCPTVAGTKENKGCPAEEAKAVDEEDAMPKIEPVYFDYDRSSYKSGEKTKVDKVISLLKENKDYKVNLVGYTDGNGTEEYNMNLSRRRVNTVVNTLTSGGIKKDRISASEKGEANPSSSNDTEEGRALNRRVEFEITD